MSSNTTPTDAPSSSADQQPQQHPFRRHRTHHRRNHATIQKPKVVLVTGAGGFIGSHVSDVLLSRGDVVIAVDEMNDYYDVRLKEANLKYLVSKHGLAKIKIYYGDICHIDFMSNIFEKERPTHICHLAARAGVRPSILDPYIYVHSNIEGTTRLLDLARQYACKNFVYASSSSVYGCSTNEILSESDLVENPVSPYAATKKACELLAYTFHHLYGLNCTGLRFFTVYGPRGRPDMAPFKFIDRIFNGVPIQQYGDGSTSRDYTYIDDIVDGVVRSIDRPLGYEVINLGNGRPFRLSDFISLVESCVGRQANIEILPEQPGDVERTCADISKAQRLLGYCPKVSFEVGISRTAEWYKEAHANGLFDVNGNSNDGNINKTPEAMAKQLQYNFIPAPVSPPLSPTNSSSNSDTDSIDQNHHTPAPHTDSEHECDNDKQRQQQQLAMINPLPPLPPITANGAAVTTVPIQYIPSSPSAIPATVTSSTANKGTRMGGMGGDEDVDNYEHYYIDHRRSEDGEEDGSGSDNGSGSICSDEEGGSDGEEEIEQKVHHRYHYHGDRSKHFKTASSTANSTVTTTTSITTLNNNMVQALVESMSDMELSSFVEKTPIQITFRSNRFVTRNVNIYINK